MRTELLATPPLTGQAAGAIPNDLGFVGPNSEYGLLEEVLLASPRNLSIVPCNRVSEDALDKGRSSCTVTASQQHGMLVHILAGAGVTVRAVSSASDLPDLTFTRDTSLMTPWGLIGLRPGAAHRKGEVDVVLASARSYGVPILGRIHEGSIEGGDVCLMRAGHIVIGVSGNRTTSTGARELARYFEDRGWEVIQTPVDPELLHLDTHFCVIDRNVALACIEMLDPPFVRKIVELGFKLIRVEPAEVASLGCNVLSLGGKRIVSAGSAPRVDEAMRNLGYDVLTTTLDEFTQCGGGSIA